MRVLTLAPSFGRCLAVLALGLVAGATALRAVESLSAQDAIRAAIVGRLGSDADVEVLSVDLPSRADAAGPYRDARPDPAAWLGRPMRFTLQPVTGAPVVAVATVRVVATYLVATRALDRNEVLSDEMIRVVREDLTGLALRRPLTLAQVQGRRLLRPLPAGAVLAPGAVIVRRAVEPGDHVTVMAVSGDIEVTASLVAADAGNPGDVIRVFNPETRRDLRGRVVKEGLVEVNYAR
jgi:flagellar basal body P-ring formation protein FlgA